MDEKRIYIWTLKSNFGGINVYTVVAKTEKEAREKIRKYIVDNGDEIEDINQLENNADEVHNLDDVISSFYLDEDCCT